LYGRGQFLLAESTVTPCPDCAAKNERLKSKDEVIAVKNEVIELLRDKVIVLAQQMEKDSAS
jgi:hypothetical protein